MLKRIPDYVDEKSLAKKYKVKVGPIIRAWKNGRSDQAISNSMGVDIWKLQQIRMDVQKAHFRYRLQKQEYTRRNP